MNVLQEPWSNLNSNSFCLTNSQPMTLLTWNNLYVIRVLSLTYFCIISKIPKFPHKGDSTSIISCGFTLIIESQIKCITLNSSVIRFYTVLQHSYKVHVIFKISPSKSIRSGSFREVNELNISKAFGHFKRFWLVLYYIIYNFHRKILFENHPSLRYNLL